MPLGSSLSIALKEWAGVCAAVEQGRQIILLRKGGIADNGGVFTLEHDQFLFFPTYLHQHRKMLKETEHREFVEEAGEPSQIRISAAGEVTDIFAVPSRAAMDALDDQHIWTSPLIDIRFNYKPLKPLYLMLVRAYRLDEPVTIENTMTYAGCISWVPLEKPIATTDARRALDESAYQARRRVIIDRLKAAGAT